MVFKKHYLFLNYFLKPNRYLRLHWFNYCFSITMWGLNCNNVVQTLVLFLKSYRFIFKFKIALAADLQISQASNLIRNLTN